MNKLGLFLHLFFFTFVSSYTYFYDTGIVIIDSQSLQQILSKNYYILVYFHETTKDILEFSSAAQALSDHLPRILCAMVDIKVEMELAFLYDIDTIQPAIILLTKGVPQKYNGPISSREIILWTHKNTGRAVKSLKTGEEVFEFKKNNEVSLVYFGDNADDLYAFYQVSKITKYYPFAASNSTDAMNKFQVKERTVVLFKNFDEIRNDLIEKISEESLSHFIRMNSYPLVIEYNNKCERIIFEQGIPALIFFIKSDPKEELKKNRLYERVAAKTKGKIQVAVANITLNDVDKLVEYYPTPIEPPNVNIYDPRFGPVIKYTMPELKIKGPNILSFINDWEEEKLKPELRTTDIQLTDNDNIYEIVGKTFDLVVMKHQKDFFIVFYNPSSIRCMYFAPIFEQLAEKLKHNKSLILGKIDSTKNDIKYFHPTTFPSLVLFPAKRKDLPVLYKGDGTIDDMIDFIQYYASYPITPSMEEL